MANFLPLKAFRPSSNDLEKVAVKSSDFETKKLMISEMENNELSFLNITNAHYLEGNQDGGAFDHAHAYVERMFEKAKWLEDEQECFYVYRQTGLHRSCTGIIGKADILEYDDNTIKKHELTRTNSEHLIADLFRSTHMLGEPVLLGHKNNAGLKELLSRVCQNPPDESFHSKMGEKHELWLIRNESEVQEASNFVADIDSLFIMDGHHRMAALSNLHSYNPEEKGRYFLANLVAEDELHIGPFHRLVEEVTISDTDLLIELSHIFDIQNFGTDISIYNPGQRNEFGMLFHGNWYSLKLRNPHHQLDVTILESEILGPIFEIFNTQTDPRLSFVKNIDEMEVVSEIQAGTNSILFTLYPVSFEEIQTVSEQGGTMPPKSTYIQPRSRPGLVIQKFL
jgi:uncharacterized protein (DUF1015 family)